MKKYMLLLILSSLSAVTWSQNKPSIAVTNPYVIGMNIKEVMLAKMLRLELIKIDKYIVFDEFEMEDAYKKDSSYKNNCLNKACMTRIGTELGVNYVLTGSFDRLSDKIVITLKMVNVASGVIEQSIVREFDDQQEEISRMIEIVLREMHQQEINTATFDRLKYQNDVIVGNNIGKLRNNGPRVGMGMLTGSLAEFATRPEDQGGLGIAPFVSMIGFQLEGQYVGTENFSGLVEGLFTISGLEQGQFIPSLALLNGFRFGKGGWEFAFGPGIGVKNESYGFFDEDGTFGEAGRYINKSEWEDYASRQYQDPTAYPQFYTNDAFVIPGPQEFNSSYNLSTRHLDTRGKTYLSTSFIFAVGKTFRFGGVNMPVNMYYSSKKKGSMVGLSVGFNVTRSKRSVRTR